MAPHRTAASGLCAVAIAVPLLGAPAASAAPVNPPRPSPQVLVRCGPAGLVRLVPPRVTGVAQVSRTLTASPGTWGPAVPSQGVLAPLTVTFQWYRGITPIAGATAARLLLTDTLFASPVHVTVTASCPGAPAVAASTTPVHVARGPRLAAWKRPAVISRVVVGHAVRATTGRWTPVAQVVRRQWLLDGRAIPGATDSSLRLRRAWRGHLLSVRVAASHHGYAVGYAVSRAWRVR